MKLVYLEDLYENWYKIGISTNYFFNDIFAALIWMDGLTKNYRVRYTNLITSEQETSLSRWHGEMARDDERDYKNYFFFELSRATSRADPNSNSAHLTTEPD
jgi:hypothetical protein